MRKIIWMMQVSLDGFMEGPERDIGWHVVDDELFRHVNAELRGIGGLLDGRVTHELMAAYWPTADADPSVPAPVAEFAALWRAVPKIVYSRTLERAGWNTTVVREVIPEDIRALKAQAGGDLVIGGADIGSVFRRLDLVDEYRIYVQPILIGRGKPMFQPSASRTRLRLAESRTFGSGVVLLRYERAAEGTD